MLQKCHPFSRFVLSTPFKNGASSGWENRKARLAPDNTGFAHNVATLKHWNKTTEHLDGSKRFT
jgi:hypothetical protein